MPCSADRAAARRELLAHRAARRLDRAARHLRLARGGGRAGRADLRVRGQHQHVLHAQLRARDLRHHGHEPLADLRGSGVDLNERFTSGRRQPHPRGRVVVEALGEADVLEPDGVADAAHHALAAGDVRDPARERRRRRPAAAATRTDSSSSRTGAGQLIAAPVGIDVPVAMALRSRSSTGSIPSAAASLSICASCAKHVCTAPNPRIAPHGGLFV